MGPQHHVEFQKKSKKPIPRKLLKIRTVISYSYDPSGHGQGYYKRISQLRGFLLITRIKFNTTQLRIPH